MPVDWDSYTWPPVRIYARPSTYTAQWNTTTINSSYTFLSFDDAVTTNDGNDEGDTAVPDTLRIFDDLPLRDEWAQFYNSSGYLYSSTSTLRRGFRRSLARQITEPSRVGELAFCQDCGYPEFINHTSSFNSRTVCRTCAGGYVACERCEEHVPRWRMGGTVDGGVACAPCRTNYYSWCSQCGSHFLNTRHADHEHPPPICCVSPALEFTIRNNGDTSLANDTRAKVTLPAGEISAEGLASIRSQVRHQWYYTDAPERDKWVLLSESLEELGNVWQNRKGNYTKRLSSHAYKMYGLKLPPKLVTMVGNIARDHSKAVDFEIEVTRQLNLSAREFAHGESCWWTSYSNSRCTLKSNGGFGIRTFEDSEVTGRAWVLPLREKTSQRSRVSLQPTFDTRACDAFLIFNGYHRLEGYAPARILSHMLGMTYRKIELSIDPIYINNDSGYLIAPERIASQYTDGELSMSLYTHSTLFNQENKESVNA